MVQNELDERYADWMIQLVSGERYSILLHQLNDTEFTYTIGMDGNRAADGIDLRYRFGRENGYPDSLIANVLDQYPCSILEMMIALSIRCEEHIMADDNYGDRTAYWFWNMIESLGLSAMDDRHYNRHYVDVTIQVFLDREYQPNGDGGLFTIRNPRRDMRGVEIWYQMCMYLETII